MMCVISGGSDQTARVRRLVWASAVCACLMHLFTVAAQKVVALGMLTWATTWNTELVSRTLLESYLSCLSRWYLSLVRSGPSCSDFHGSDSRGIPGVTCEIPGMPHFLFYLFILFYCLFVCR